MALNNTVRVGIERPQERQINLASHELLPRAPGNNWGDAAFRDAHHKKHALSTEFSGRSGTEYKPTYVKAPKCAPQVSSPTAQQLANCLTGNAPFAATSTMSSVPWLTLSDKVCRFYAYFEEQEAESPIEKRRVRKVVITHYVEDDTTMVNERTPLNSGIQGGVFLRRQRVPCPNADHEYISIDDFNVGGTVTLFGRVFHLYSCDAKTREFLESLGVVVPEDAADPDDNFVAYRQTVIDPKRKARSFDDKDFSTCMESLAFGKTSTRFGDEVTRAKRFLFGENTVFCYSAYWDTRDTEGGTVRKFEIRFHAQSGEVSVIERLPMNSGYDPSRAFVGRRRLPKPHANMSKTVELTFAARVNGLSQAHLGGQDDYYELPDFEIGRTISVFGRDLVIYDCDEYTRQQLQLAPPIDITAMDAKKSVPRLPVPPPNGFGTDEDSKASCAKSLVLRPPKKDLTKWKALDGEMLRYQLKLHRPPMKEDEMREFVLTYYPSDDTIMVLELPLRNTGYTGGKFIKRQRVKKPESSGSNIEYYSLDDISVGTVLTLCGFKMEVKDIDKHTELYLEQQLTDPTHLPEERLRDLFNKFQSFLAAKFTSMTEAFRSMDRDRDGYITQGELLEVLRNNQLSNVPHDATALLELLGDGAQLSYVQFLEGISRQTKQISGDLKVTDEKLQNSDGTALEKKGLIRRNQLLKELKERLEGRRLNVVEMHRLLASMPRSVKTRTGGDISALTNDARDGLLSPVQLYRGMVESLGMQLTQEEALMILHFFFPDASDAECLGTATTSKNQFLNLAAFNKKFLEMAGIGQLSAISVL